MDYKKTSKKADMVDFLAGCNKFRFSQGVG
jgi:hypothetical protein